MIKVNFHFSARFFLNVLVFSCSNSLWISLLEFSSSSVELVIRICYLKFFCSAQPAHSKLSKLSLVKSLHFPIAVKVLGFSKLGFSAVQFDF
jgi:hypothetical protein